MLTKGKFGHALNLQAAIYGCNTINQYRQSLGYAQLNFHPLSLQILYYRSIKLAP